MLTQLIVWLNAAAGLFARIVLAPIAWLPGWLSATLVGVVTGVLMLWAFKHTSNQSAILRTRNQIKANLLALSLFKDSMAVSLRAQGRLLLNAGRLLALSLVPMLIMLAPMCLLLGQLAVWYQARALPVGSETVVTAHLVMGDIDYLSEARLETSPAFDLRAGPVHIGGRDMICWRIQAMQPGVHELTLTIDGQSFTKEVSIGEGFLPVSSVRPAWNWSDARLNPRERPFPNESPVQSIEVAYPPRASWTSGTDHWVIYWFAVSLIAAFAARPLLKVNI